MVIAPAKTGRDNSNKIVVIKIDHAKRGVWFRLIPDPRRFPKVLIKFTAPRRDDTPAKWREKIAKSTDGPECAILLLRGGYTVHPVPAPAPTKDLPVNITNAGSKNQNLILFKRGKAMSGAPIIIGINQLPNPPIKTGITIKKIMIKACAVTTTLYNWSSPRRDPGCPNSIRIIILKPVPNIPLHAPTPK